MTANEMFAAIVIRGAELSILANRIVTKVAFQYFTNLRTEINRHEYTSP